MENKTLHQNTYKKIMQKMKKFHKNEMKIMN